MYTNILHIIIVAKLQQQHYRNFLSVVSIDFFGLMTKPGESEEGEGCLKKVDISDNKIQLCNNFIFTMCLNIFCS